MVVSDEWRWTDDQGVQRVVRADELRAALASSVLAPSTLVWREGMTSWVPAFAVPELGASLPSPAELPADGTTDIAPAPKMKIGAEVTGITSTGVEPPPVEKPSWAFGAHGQSPAENSSSGLAPVPSPAVVAPPAMVRPHNVVPNVAPQGSAADTGRPTPTELLEGLARGPSGNGAAAPRPAAGRDATGRDAAGRDAAGREPAGGLKIAAAPRPTAPAIAPAPRPVATRSEGTAPGGSSRTTAQRAGGWRKPEGVKAKNDDEVTRVAETSEPFKVKPTGDGGARATSSPTKAGGEPRKEAGRATQPPAARRPGEDASRQPVRPAAGRPASVPPPPVRVRPSTVPPAGAARGATVPGAPRAPSATGGATPAPGPSGMSSAFMGSAARGAEEGAQGAPSPGAARLPNVVKPSFAIVENTSTDSTGVLPLSGKYAAEPKSDHRAPVPSYVDGAPPFAERTPSFPDAAPGPVLLGAASPEAARQGASPAEMSAEPQAHMQPGPMASPSHSAGGSYPPVPEPMFGVPRVEAEIHPHPHGYPAAPGARPLRSTIRMSSQAPGYAPSPYSAPPPPLALGQPSIGDVRNAPLTEPPPGTTGALPLVNAKRSLTPPPLDLVDPAAQPPEAFAAPPSKVGDPVTVPLSSLFAAGGMLITMAVAAFFIGRCSVEPGSGATPARASLAALPRLARASLPSPPKPCWMAKQPVRWADTVLQSIPVDVAPTASGVVVAYARSSREPATVEVDFSTGAFNDKPSDKVSGDIVRVVAPREGGKLLVTTKEDSGPLAPYVYAPGRSPFVIGVAGRGTPSAAVAAAERPDAAPVNLWTLAAAEEDKGLEAARVLGYGPSSHAVVFRRSGAILGGFVSEGRKAEGALFTIAGSGGTVGKPSLGENKREIAIIFADKAKKESPWEIRVGHAPLGQMPRETAVVPLPKGGPGGDAFAPDIAGTADGRWVITWTEGQPGACAVRAQTFSSDLKPLGDPIAVSPPAGNYGQAVLGVAGGYVTTMFLSKGASGSYELWGAVLQCGS